MAYEVHIGSDQMNETGEYEVFTGIQVETLENIPIECVGKVFPSTQYAEFTLVGEEIVSDWTRWIYEAGCLTQDTNRLLNTLFRFMMNLLKV